MQKELTKDSQTLCPSARPDWHGAVIIGVIGGAAEAPLLTHLTTPQKPTSEILALAASVTPTEVFRFAAPCRNGGCAHFRESKCSLTQRLVQLLPVATSELPACSIRSSCRWWQQEGRAACLRCPQVVTDNYHPSEAMCQVATPPTDV